MHTPEQAENLWCPMVRMTDGEDHPRNAGITLDYRKPAVAICIADKCAMWRWGTYIAPPLDAEPGKLVAGVNHRSDRGYCGLAGTPVVAA